MTRTAPTRVLIAADDSDGSLTAARTARQLFGDEAQYTVVSVADNGPLMWAGSSMEWGMAYPMTLSPVGYAGPFIVGGPDTDAQIAEPAGLAEHHAEAVAGAADLPDAETVGEVGDPASAVLAAAERIDADVIVVGSTHRGWFDRLLVPSVSKEILRESPVAVLVVPT